MDGEKRERKSKIYIHIEETNKEERKRGENIIMREKGNRSEELRGRGKERSEQIRLTERSNHYFVCVLSLTKWSISIGSILNDLHATLRAFTLFTTLLLFYKEREKEGGIMKLNPKKLKQTKPDYNKHQLITTHVHTP